MITAASILVSVSLAGILFCWWKLIKISCIKKVKGVLPIKEKKWRKMLIYIILACVIFIILGIIVFFAWAK